MNIFILQYISDVKVVQLEYEAYEPMALKAMKNICGEIRQKWQVENIAIYHSVVIAVSSPHRSESLQAVQFAIDSLKASTPIWKKEIYASEEGQWKENQECTWTSK
ncbi:Molybdopterin synthase catalytic subunit 1 [Blattella germanica]|nr:Molybdopterin synthase catalytic subunit 1 [Blattella germanica]